MTTHEPHMDHTMEHTTMKPHMDHGAMTDMDHGSGGAHGTAFNIQQPFTMLFSSWVIESDGDLAWTCVVLALICIFYEGVKAAKIFLGKKALYDSKL